MINDRIMYREPIPQEKSSTTKYLIIIAVLLGIVLIALKYSDEISREVKKIMSKMEIEPSEKFSLYWSCITFKTPWNQCWSGTPIQQPSKYNVISVNLGDNEGKLNTPITGQYFYLPVKITNFLKDEVFDVKISGTLMCEKKLGDEEFDVFIDLNPISSQETFEVVDEIEITLKSEEILTCELQNCDKVIVDVKYSHFNNLESDFMLVKSSEDASLSEDDKLTQGPILIETSFQPYNYYYIERDIPEFDIEFRLKNKGNGKAFINSIEFKKVGDEYNEFIGLSGCDCGTLGVEFKDDGEKVDIENFPLKGGVSKSCFCKYITNNPEGFLSGARFKTIFFYFTAYYDYRERVERRTPKFEKLGCSDENPTTTISTNGDDIDEFLSSKSSGASPLIGLKRCISSASSKSGIPMIVFYAIPIQEGGYSGTSLQKGNCNNLYSIKGSGCPKETWECFISTDDFTGCTEIYEPGEEGNKCGGNFYHCVKVDGFESYNSGCSSVNGFVEKIEGNWYWEGGGKDTKRPNCKPVKNYLNDAKRFVQALKDCGYATDPNWPTKVGNIIDIIEPYLP